MIGMATIVDGYPLYYDATNEKGLSMAGLNFPDNAYYRKLEEGRENIATYEFILWILSQCRSVKEARVLCEKMNLTNQAFSEKFPALISTTLVMQLNGTLMLLLVLLQLLWLM